MARRTWHDFPATDSPLSAALINDLEARKPEMDRVVEVNVSEDPYNATGLGVASDVTAIMAAVDSLPQTGDSRGGRVSLGRGRVYKIDSNLNLTGYNSVEFVGSGATSNKQATTLRWSGAASSGTMLTVESTQGMTFRNMRIDYSDAAYDGNLIQCGEATVGVPTSNLKFESCWMGGSFGNVGARSVLSLNEVANVKIDGCSFMGAQNGIIGIDPGFSNNVQIVGGTLFNFISSACIRNPGQGWTISGCSFEPLTDGKAGAIKHDSAVLARGLSIHGCWMGDCTVDGGIWVDVYAFGLTLTACYMDISVSGGASTTATHVRLENCEGVLIAGAEFVEGGKWVDVATLCYGLSLHGNRPQGIDAYLTGVAPVGLSAVGNSNMPNAVNGDTKFNGYVYANTGAATQVRVGEVAGVAGLLFHSDGDTYIYRTALGHVGVNKAWTFPQAITSASASNNSIFRDSADDVIKKKDNVGAVTAI